jgi:hypothetical protein
VGLEGYPLGAGRQPVRLHGAAFTDNDDVMDSEAHTVEVARFAACQYVAQYYAVCREGSTRQQVPGVTAGVQHAVTELASQQTPAERTVGQLRMLKVAAAHRLAQLFGAE